MVVSIASISSDLIEFPVYHSQGKRTDNLSNPQLLKFSARERLTCHATVLVLRP